MEPKNSISMLLSTAEGRETADQTVKRFFSRKDILCNVVNYSATSYRASCFSHHRLTIQESIDRSYTVSTSVRFGLSQPYQS